MEKERTKPYLVRIPPTMHDKAGKVAEGLGLSFSAYVRHLIAKDVKKATP